MIPSYDENPDWPSSLNDFETLYQQGSDPINFLSQAKQSYMQMELTYQEAGKPLQKAYDSESGLIAFTLGRMEEGIMEKLIERRLQTTGSDEWDTWAEFTKDVKQVHDIIQAVRKIARAMEKKMKRKKRASEIAADPLEPRARKVAVGGVRQGMGVTIVPLSRTTSRIKYGTKRHMIAAPCGWKSLEDRLPRSWF